MLERLDSAMCKFDLLPQKNECNSIPEFIFTTGVELNCSTKKPCGSEESEVSSLGESLKTYFSCSSFCEASSNENLVALDLPVTDSDSLSDKSETTQEEDAFAILSDDVIYYVCSYLDVLSLISFSECSRFLNKLTSKSEASWSEKCELLWKDKVHVCKEALNKMREFNALNKEKKAHHIGSKDAYKLSILDAKYRQEITAEEICNFTWSFRFKEAAGQDWTSWDPWWNNEEARQMAFLPDGRVLQVHYESDNDYIRSHKRRKRDNQTGPFHQRHENDIISLQNVFADETNARVNNFRNIEVRWRFVTAPLDLPSRSIGGYVRLTIDGKEVPTYIVRRSPTNNWGFILENCWGIYSSFQMPCKGDSELLEDKNMIISNECQWREAFLYNSGASSLPEGDAALREFESLWKESFGNQGNVF